MEEDAIHCRQYDLFLSQYNPLTLKHVFLSAS